MIWVSIVSVSTLTLFLQTPSAPSSSPPAIPGKTMFSLPTSNSRLFGPFSFLRATPDVQVPKQSVEERMESPQPSSSTDEASPMLLAEVWLEDESVWVRLDDSAPLEAVLEDLRQAIRVSRSVIRRMFVKVDIGNRVPERNVVRQVKHILSEERGLTLLGMRCSDGALRAYATHDLRIQLETGSETGDDENAPVVLQRTLRSGQALRVEGDLILYGDVNAGAIVEAGGSVTVIGALRGTVHAGCLGNRCARIMAIRMKPTQLRIGDCIASAESLLPQNASGGPLIAHLKGNQMKVEDYRSRLMAAHGGPS
jgi:septum site-determining protein MinC